MRVLSIYSGCGGLDLGFVRAGFGVVWANDVNGDAVASYNNNTELTRGEHKAVLGDIRELRLPGRGAAEVVIGGPPCQGFSVAGKRNPDDPRSKHVFEFMNAVWRVGPRAFVMENVKALACNPRWEEVRIGLEQIAHELGYTTGFWTLDASNFGVPQKRERLFLVGIRGAEAVTPPRPLGDRPKTVRHVLQMLPPFGTRGNDTLTGSKITFAKNPVLRGSAYSGMMFNGKGRPMNLDKPAPTITAAGGNGLPIVDQKALTTGGPNWVEEYHKTLLAGKPTPTKVPARLRRITVEEACALQTFPCGLSWVGTTSSQYRQVGNAVPPLLAFHVARRLKELLT